LRYWDGSAWVAVNSPTSGTTSPTGPVDGELWYDTTTPPGALKYWDGSSWESVGGSAFVPSTGSYPVGTMVTALSFAIPADRVFQNIAPRTLYTGDFNAPVGCNLTISVGTWMYLGYTGYNWTHSICDPKFYYGLYQRVA
jgi:hypothetical protein